MSNGRFAQVIEMIGRGEMADGPSALAVLLCLPRLGDG